MPRRGMAARRARAGGPSHDPTLMEAKGGLDGMPRRGMAARRERAGGPSHDAPPVIALLAL